MSLTRFYAPSQAFCEAFEERLHDGTIDAETLAHVVSVTQEANPCESRDPEANGHAPRFVPDDSDQEEVCVHLPSNTESFRTKYQAMTFLRPFAQIREPSRKLQADLSKDTWDDFLEKLLSEDNIHFAGSDMNGLSI